MSCQEGVGRARGLRNASPRNASEPRRLPSWPWPPIAATVTGLLLELSKLWHCFVIPDPKIDLPDVSVQGAGISPIYNVTMTQGVSRIS